MKTPITRARLRQHLTYSLWKYALLVCIVLFGWNVLYSVTAYRPPQEKIVDIYIYGFGEYEDLNAYMERVRQSEMPDMEQMTTTFLPVDEMYGLMALTARVAAGEGDIYILPREVFQTASSEGWFLPLEDRAQVLAYCEERGVELERGWRRVTNDEDRARHLFGIPLSSMPGVGQYVYGDDFFVSVLYNNGNTDNVLMFLDILMRDMGPDAVIAPAEQ